MKKLVLVAAALALSLSPLLAQPAPAGRECPAGMGDRSMGRLQDRLDLSEAQTKKIQEIRTHYAEKLSAKTFAAQNARRAFQQACNKPETSVEELRKLHQTQSEAQFDQFLLRRDMHKEIRAVLTPEQREKMDKLPTPGMRHGGWRK